MTASALQYRAQPARRPRGNARVARVAAQTRRKRSLSLRYRSIVRIIQTLAAATVLIVGYLWLMANVTRMNYEYARATHERTQLLDETTALEDQIARLESRERLADLAAKLGMNEPARFSVAVLTASPTHVATEQPPPAVRGVTLLPAITDWLR
jgi:cell division protein FtsL